LLLLAAASVCACATATNYLDPAGPRYVGGAARAPLPRARLRVVSFNIEYGKKVDAAIEALRQAPLRDADVFSLQELDAPGVERIAQALGLNYVFFPSALLPKTGRDFGAALLSPWPLREPRKLVLPHAGRIVGVRRCLTIATLDRGYDRYRVYAVHLPSPLGVSGAQRRDQVQAILDDAAAVTDPLLVVGDLNTREVARLFEQAGYLWLTREVGTTAHRYGLHFSFDHVFARGLLPGSTFEAGVVRDNRGASDHSPIWSLLRPPVAGPRD